MLKHPAFQAAPHLGQLAKNGSWETAWSFEHHAIPTLVDVRAFLAGATEVAFEAFFGEAFFGARLSGQAQEVERFSLCCAAALQASTDGVSFFNHLSNTTGLRGFGQSISFAEIGAVNAWKSVGSFKTGLPQDALQGFEGLWSALASTALYRNSSHRKAVEFAYLLPLPHWFALPISSPFPPFEISRNQLQRAYEFAAGG